MSTPDYRRALREARALLAAEPGNQEFERGMSELLARLYPENDRAQEAARRGQIEQEDA